MMKIWLLLAVPAVASAVPSTLLHQGRVLDAAGNPYDGTVSLDIHLWAGETSNTSLWFGEADVIAQDGYYAVVLGQPPMDPIDADLLTTDDIWVGVKANNDPENRSPVTSTVFALQAESVDGGVVNASEVRVNDAVVIDNTGTFVGTPGSSPLSALTQGIEGTFKYCGRNDSSSAGCQIGPGIPAVCFRTASELSVNPGMEGFASQFITQAAYWGGGEWREIGRGSGGPCAQGIIMWTPTPATAGATPTNLHFCGRNDNSSASHCSYPLDGWPVVCLRSDSSEHANRGGFMAVMAHFTGGEWRGITRGTGGACTHGVWFWNID